ncbi:MAG: glycosyltransferase, partial [Acidimicrobiales bacterium]
MNLDLVLAAMGWLAGGWLLWSLPRVGPLAFGPSHHGPSVSVVIPARDEADNLPTLLASLATQDPAPV